MKRITYKETKESDGRVTGRFFKDGVEFARLSDNLINDLRCFLKTDDEIKSEIKNALFYELNDLSLENECVEVLEEEFENRKYKNDTLHKNKKVKCTFENLTPKQAKILSEWYEGQGEQDANIWFDEHGVEVPYTDVSRKGGYREIDEEGNVKVFCK